LLNHWSDQWALLYRCLGPTRAWGWNRARRP